MKKLLYQEENTSQLEILRLAFKLAHVALKD